MKLRLSYYWVTPLKDEDSSYVLKLLADSLMQYISVTHGCAM